MEKCKQIFIVGMPRSGTTLLQLILTNHSRIAIAPETHFFRLFWSKKEKYGDLLDDQNFHRICNDLMNCEYIRNLQIPDCEKVIRKADRREFYKNVSRILLKEYASKYGKEIYGEKTPSNLEYVRYILKIFPGARIINIYRNPFDVAASIKKVPWGANNVVDISKRWRKYIRLALEYQEYFGKNFYSIKYEDLVHNTDSEIRRICNFLSVNFEINMIQFYLKTDVPVFNKDKYWHENCFQPISAINIGKGFRELDLDEIRFIKYYCLKYLELLGYRDLLEDYEETTNIKIEKNILFDIIERVKFRSILFMRSTVFKKAFAALKSIRECFK